MPPSMDKKNKIDFYFGWFFVLIALLIFSYALSIVYSQRQKDFSYVERLEEQVFCLKQENVDLKHELRNKIRQFKESSLYAGK